MTDDQLQKLFELFTAVLFEVRAGQVRMEKRLEKLEQEIRELATKLQPPEP